MKKKVLFILLGLIVLTSILGISYASWLFTSKQRNFNTLGSKCFELTMTNESEGISLSKAYPISDEEGLSTTGYTFTIKNTCNTHATYEVNLEDMLVEEKRLSGEYIKVSINDGTPVSLKNLEEKEAHIEGSDKSYELTSGSLGPEEETTYTIKLWMDESTPAIEETMNATFLSKISIEAGYTPEENLENEIILEAKSLTESLNNKSEIFEITGTSTNYDLIEYSLDKSHWSRIESPSKNVTITQEFTEEGKHAFYIRDEVGNIKEIEIQTTKLDKTVPEIEIVPKDFQESIELSIKFTENQNLSGYAITESSEEPTEWINIEGKETTIEYVLTENTTYYIWVKDSVGNISYQKYSTDTIDTQAPELEITNTLTDWGVRDTITIKATDDVVGISGVSISTIEGTYNWEFVENTLNYETEKEITENGTYYISVRDAYGHITTKSIVIDKVDNNLPTIQVEVKQDKYILDITVTAEDTLSGIKEYYYQVDENEWEKTTENTRQYTELSDGEHTIKVKVQDKVGNESEVFSKKVVIYHEYEASIFLANGTIEGGTTLTNLITNGSFEDDGKNWTTSADFKTINNSISGTLVSTDVYQGKKAVYINDTSATQGYWNYQKLVPATDVNDQIYAAGYFKGNGSNTGSMLFTYQNNEGNKVDFGSTSTINSKYEKVSIYEISPSSTMMFQFGSLSTGIHTNYFDAFYVINVTDDFKENIPDKEWLDERTEYFDKTASILTQTVNTKDETSIPVSLLTGYVVEEVKCSNADAKIENNILTINNIKGDVQCKIKSKDTTVPNSSFTIGSNTAGSNNWYKALSIKINVSDTGSGVSSAKYCTTTGSTCTPGTNATISNNSFTVTLGSNASAQKVCSQVIDNAGNQSNVQCSSTYRVDTTNPSQSFSIGSSTSGLNGWYKALGVKVTLSDSHSGVSSAKYCTTTGSTCTPGTNATISSNSFTVTLGSNASAQKVCAQTTDKSGRTSSVTCSSTYKVDTINPTAKISATVSNNTIKVSASGSSDAHSKIDKYQYSRDNKTWYTSTSNSYTFTGLADGTYTVYVKVTDKSGRVSSVVNTKVTVKNYVYLYDYGTTNTSLVGSWTIVYGSKMFGSGWGSSSSYISYAKNSNNMTFNITGRSSMQSSATMNRAIGIISSKKISMSGYSKINILYDLTISSFAGDADHKFTLFRFQLGNSSSSVQGFTEDARVAKTVSVGNNFSGSTYTKKITSIDLGSLQSSYYVLANIATILDNYNSSMKLVIYQIWLS